MMEFIERHIRMIYTIMIFAIAILIVYGMLSPNGFSAQGYRY